MGVDVPVCERENGGRGREKEGDRGEGWRHGGRVEKGHVRVKGDGNKEGRYEKAGIVHA